MDAKTDRPVTKDGADVVDTLHTLDSADIEVQQVDDQLMTLANAAPPFWKNRKLLELYLLMIPGCIVPAVTLGFDSAMMNGLQAVATWNSCKFFPSP